MISRLMLLDKLSPLNVKIISNTQISCVDRGESVLKQLVLTKVTVLEGYCIQKKQEFNVTYT